MTSAGAAASSTSGCDSCHLLDDQMAFLREETKKRGFPTIDGVHMGPCEIHRSHAHTIGPDGSLYACPGFAGDAHAVDRPHRRPAGAGARARGAARFEALSAWKECRDCAFIPVCAGGCTVAAYTELGSIDKPNCHKTAIQAGARVARARRRPPSAPQPSTSHVTTHPSPNGSGGSHEEREEAGQERHAPPLARRRRRRQPALSPHPVITHFICGVTHEDSGSQEGQRQSQGFGSVPVPGGVPPEAAKK